MKKPHIGELIFFFVLFAVVGYFAFMIMKPYLTALFLAGVLTIVFLPLYRKLHQLIRRQESIAAFATVLIVLLLILTPLAILGSLMFQEVIGIYDGLTRGGAGVMAIDVWTTDLEQAIQTIIPTFTIDLDFYQYLERGLAWIAQNLNTFLSGMASFIFDIFLIIVAMFFFMRDGRKLKEFAIKWSPLADSYDESIFSKLDLAVSSVVKGALATAIAQGVLIGTGFAIFGVPNPVLWGFIGAIAALIPLLGTTLVTVPAVIILFASGNIGGAVGLLLWSMVCVGLIDNLLSPMLIKRGVHIHPFLILLSVFGGLAFFGPIGFLAGPIVMAFFFTLLDLYPGVVRGRVADPDSVEST